MYLKLNENTASPDRWLDLPKNAKQQPGLYPSLLTFSAGPRVSGLATVPNDPDLLQSCIGMRFAVIECVSLADFHLLKPEYRDTT